MLPVSPRCVLLGAAAYGAWVYPSRGGDEPLDRNDLWTFWTGARREAGTVTDARLPTLDAGTDLHATG